MKFFYKILNSLKKYGLINFIKLVIKRISDRYFFYNNFVKLKKKIQNNFKKFGSIVLHGNYKGLKLNYHQYKNDITFVPKMIGTYEKNVQNKLIELSKKYSLSVIINFGAFDGYHALGLLKKNIYKYALLFEIDKKSATFLTKNIKENNLEKKSILFNKKANFLDLNIASSIFFLKEYKHIEKKVIFLVDIESDEFSLFNESNLKYFRNSFLLIEIHDAFVKNKRKVRLFNKLLSKYYVIERINMNTNYDLSIKEFNHFSEDERLLIVSEGRPILMHWIVCYPKFK
jgi:hypothetical protein